MDNTLALIGIIVAILIMFGGYVLTFPRIVFTKDWNTKDSNSWGKDVYVASKYEALPTTDPSDTDISWYKETHHYYGITVHNKRFFPLGLSKADIFSTDIEIWNSDGSFYTGKYKARYWNSGNSIPLYFSGHPKAPDIGYDKGKQTIGDDGELNLVVLYENINEDGLYRFTIESDLKHSTQTPNEKLPYTFPLYAYVNIHADKNNPKKYLEIYLDEGKNIRIKTIAWWRIPFFIIKRRFLKPAT